MAYQDEGYDDWTDPVDSVPYLRPIDDGEADAEVAAVYSEIQKYYGYVPKLYRTLAHYPPLLRANWQKIKAVMGQGALRPKLKEAVAVMISQANDCKYCVQIHSGMLRRLGESEHSIRSMRSFELRTCTFLNEKEKALLCFAQKVNRSAPAVEKSDIEVLRQLGVTDAELIQLFGVIDLYASYNKLLVSLRVELEEDDPIGHGTYPRESEPMRRPDPGGDQRL